MIVKAGLLIDFGNSETRVIVLSGQKAFRFNMSNKFAELSAGYRINSKYANEKSTVFKVNNSYYANGQIVEREFQGLELRPSALQSKTNQLVTDLTINLAFIKALMVLAKAYNVPVSSLEVTFNVSALLPPLDHEVNEEKLKAKFMAMNNVSTLIPLQMDIQFKVEDANIHPEAVAAFFGAFYKEEGAQVTSVNSDIVVFDNGQHISLVEVEENKQFMNGYVLVLDIGAGTTDVALFLDMELVERSKDTFNRGGNTVESIIRNELKKKFGFVPTSMQRVISEGILEEGTTLHDVSDIVTMAKDTYSKAMLEDLRQYLERMTIPMQAVKGLLVAGGGSLPSIRDGQVVSPAMAEVLMGYLKTLAPRMEALHVEGKNLRDLNIEGLMYIHKYS